MSRVLFVDDEPNVLDALRRMLHPMGKRWELVFASSGQEALAILGQAQFDIIVTDMRMPGMDGAQLLAEVMDRYPNMVRIVFSGHSDPAFILRSVKAAHQYLAKPCDPQILCSTIERALSLRGLFSDHSVQELVSQIESLPSLPSVYEEILAELHSPDPSPQRVGNIVAKDLAMTAKILQLVNSAFFGLFSRVTNAVEAVRYLGIETVKALALSLHLFSELRPTPLEGFSVEELWEHSLKVAGAARAVAWNDTHDPSIADASFTAGLLHDSGRLIMATKLPQRYAPILEQVAKEGRNLWEVERNSLGTSHGEVGAYLLGIWGLPQDVVEAVLFHHEPSRGLSSVGGVDPLIAVHVSDAFLLQRDGGPGGPAGPGPDRGHLDSLGLGDRLQGWEEICEKTWGKDG